MSNMIATDTGYMVLGLGKTGYSCVQYLAQNGYRVSVADTREAPPYLADVKKNYPEIAVYLGGLEQAPLQQAAVLVISPGLPLSSPAIVAAQEKGVEVIGDIDLFRRAVSAPIVAITGSNAKSTVTTLVGEMAEKAGIDVAVGGNLGTPVLDLLQGAEKELYVLELSSFQLETTHALQAEVATVLNISPDHMDRYETILDYHQAKHRVFKGVKKIVVNKDDALSAPMVPDTVSVQRFTSNQPDLNEYGLLNEDGKTWLALGKEKLLPASALKMKGVHNLSNALAALALGSAVNIPQQAMLDCLIDFSGLAHRCQWIKTIDGVDYYNDSKGTNVGATEAAINGFGADIDGKIILIAGGEGKGADFHELQSPSKKYVKKAILIGSDAPLLASALKGCCNTVFAKTLHDAVIAAKTTACKGDLVLLSPACASFDMFNNFEHRGDCFVEEVLSL
jgi:UDP-N-acetylmuramoylalanine--D-glutamate ligase